MARFVLGSHRRNSFGLRIIAIVRDLLRPISLLEEFVLSVRGESYWSPQLRFLASSGVNLQVRLSRIRVLHLLAGCYSSLLLPELAILLDDLKNLGHLLKSLYLKVSLNFEDIHGHFFQIVFPLDLSKFLLLIVEGIENIRGHI